ncbi:claspin-like isoform X2 [Biomphalaria glabrata]|uniref:Claspin-like isoform X2 n=1 Tax=Biomphalaria glabrata TaxID=6526 RepID=A0A9W2ZTT5_BIOGL|nr:claspin-like isoform X2 [Biomphalaria glabrata]
MSVDSGYHHVSTASHEDSDESKPVKSDIVIEEQTVKSDSGMEEESFNHSSAGLSESSDNEMDDLSVKKRSRGNRRMIFDDDDDDDEKQPMEEDKESQDQDKSQEDSDRESDAEKSDHNQEVSETYSEKPLKMDLKTNSDLFDAELSDEDKPASTNGNDDSGDNVENNDTDEDDNENDNDSNDEGFDESQLNPELLAKLKKLKGAGKKGKERTKYERKSKPSAEKMLEIYSDSQKLLRTSRINLPYYEPETKSLNDFLARASKKRQEYAGLKRAKDIVKAQIIQEKLSVPVLPSPPHKHNSRSRGSNEQRESGITEATSPSKVSLSQNGVADDSGLSSSDPLRSQQQSISFPDSLGNDELPDILPREIHAQSDHLTNILNQDSQISSEHCRLTIDVNEAKSESHTLSHEGLNSSQLTPILDSCSQDDTAPCENENEEVPSLQKDPSRDLFISSESLTSDNPKETVLKYTGCSKDNFNSNDEHLVLSNPSVEPRTSADLSPKLSKINDSELSSSEAGHKRKKSLLEKLQGIELPNLPLPHLSGSPSEIICLVEPSKDTTPKNPGLVKLMNKFAEHSKRRTPRGAHNVNLSIIAKEGEEGARKELKLHSLTYNVQEEEEILPEDTPGSKLLKLKQQLDVGMKLKREVARQRRLQMYALENEEGFEGRKEEEEEELEEEMTESESSSDDEGEEDVEKLIGEDFGDESEDEKDYNPLLDNEAAEDSDDESGDDVQSEKDENVNEDSNDIRLHFDTSDEDEANEDNAKNDNNCSDSEEILTSRKKRPVKAVVDSDADDDDQNNDEGKDQADVPTQILESDTKKDSFGDSGRDPLIGLWSYEATPQDTDSQEKAKFRRENSRSPELYTCDQAESQFSSAQHLENSDSSQFVTNSPMLDKDGFIKLSRRPAGFKLVSQDSHNKISSLVNSGAEELTPGNIFKDFNSQLASSQAFTPGNIFQDFKTQPASSGLKEDDLSQDKQSLDYETQATNSGQDDLSHDKNSLDSFKHFGKETIRKEDLKSMKDVKYPSKHSIYTSLSDDDDNDIYDPFSVLTKKEDGSKSKKEKIIKPVLTDSEDENNDSDASKDDFLASEDEQENDREADTDIEEESNHSVQNLKFSGFKDKRKGIRKEFVEDEAELSGSEFESDEDLDLPEAEDILEEEEGDKEMAGVSEEQLREEVGRVHMKRLQDDDDKEMMYLKERYLQDGDLYSDGAGRMRNFRWKNSETDSQQDMFLNLSDDEHVDEDNDEQQWRKDRYEREKFLEEAAPEPNEEDSQLLKLGHVFLKKKESSITKENLPAPKQKMMPPEPPKPKLSKKGSFLSRKDDTLIKIAQVTKTIGTTARNTKNFIFQSLDQQESQDAGVHKDVAPSKRKAHTPSQSEQPAKKVKVADLQSSPLHPKRRDSIFKLLD